MGGLTTNYSTDLGNVFVSYADIVATQPIASLYQVINNGEGTIAAPLLVQNFYGVNSTEQFINLQDKFYTSPTTYPWPTFIIYAKTGFTITLNVYNSSYTTSGSGSWQSPGTPGTFLPQVMEAKTL